jgi:hypothetical protein
MKNYLAKVNHYFFEFKEARKNANKTQEMLLLSLIKKNKNTLYGKKYGFDKISSVKDFQEKVPIIEYEDLHEYIDLLKKGTQNVLTKDKVIFFATTSGTTKKTKLIPVTKQRRITFRKELYLWSFNFLKKFPLILQGKLLYFAGPYNEGKTEANIMYGSISGYLAHKTPWYAKQKLAIPTKLYNEQDFDKKMFQISKIAVKSNITQIGFAFPVEVIMFFDYLKKNKEKLIQEIKKENPWKARILQNKEFVPEKLWPNLKVINCIKSEQNRPYIEALQKKLPFVLINDPGIYSSEGRISLCLKPGAEAGIVPVTINFFEFRDVETNKILLAGNLEKGKKYDVILTNQEGLYRYEMNDVVEVQDFKETIPLIKFYERKNYMNIAGELAHERVLMETMQETLQELKMKIRGYTFAPSEIKHNQKPRYNIIIEPLNSMKKDQAVIFLKKIEENLQKNISDYRQMRNEFGRIMKPELTILKKGEYDAFDKKRMSRGGQQKPIIISKEADFVKNFKIDSQYK